MLLQVSKRFESISQWIFPFKETALCIANVVKKAAINCFSSKQSMRQDSTRESIHYATLNFQGFLRLQYWKLHSFILKNRHDEEARVYSQALKGIKKLIDDIKEGLTFDEKSSLNAFFQRGLFDHVELEHLHLLFLFRKIPDLERSHFTFLKILRLQDESFFNELRLRIEAVSGCLEGQEMDESKKLEIMDCYMIGNAESICNLIETLQTQGVSNLNSLLLKWQTIRTLSQSSPFLELKKLCWESHAAGSVFLVDWAKIETIMGQAHTFKRALQHLLMGRWGHIAIVVSAEGGKKALSHVNRETENHAVTPIKNEMIFPFYDSLEINITPLMPKNFSDEDRQMLQQSFSQAFQRIALELHPEVYLAGNKELLSLLLSGHKTLFAQSISNVDFPEKGSRITCSSYVGIVFLKAIQEVNLILEQKGYEERIAHPFGSHESIAHLDILRLVYLWNHLKIIKETSLHPTIAKVMSLSRGTFPV